MLCNSCVVYKNVDIPELSRDRVEHSVNRLSVGNVCLNSGGFNTVGVGKNSREVFRVLSVIVVVNGDVPASLGKGNT